MTVVVVVGADLGGPGPVDVTWRDGQVIGVGPAGSARPATDDRVVDAEGGALVPGLHDHHIHLWALAAARRSVSAGPPAVRDRADLVRTLTAAARGAVPGEWVRAVGYHESVAGDLDAVAIDRLGPAVAAVPVRLQHRSGQQWVLNTEALRRTGVDKLDHPGVERGPDGAPTGRLHGLDGWIRRHVPAAVLDMAALGAELVGYGVTGATETTPTESAGDLSAMEEAVTDPSFPVRITLTGGPDLDPGAAPALPRGPVKILPAERDAADLQGLVARFQAARATGRPVAVHCVTRIGLVVALAAWDQVGSAPGDRIEHGAVVPAELVDELAHRGLTVITQPNLVAERGDAYRVEVDASDQPNLWRCRSLLDAGVPVAAGTDAPFGHPDPWRAVTAAVHRRTPDGAVLGPAEQVDPATALGLFLGAPDHPGGPRRRVSAGVRTDLCLLRVPLADALADPSAAHVRLTIGRAGITPASHG